MHTLDLCRDHRLNPLANSRRSTYGAGPGARADRRWQRPAWVQHGDMDETHRWFVRVTTTAGGSLYWHRGGARHTLANALGPHWVANFKPALFQITPHGSIIPRGSQPDALDISSVALAPVPAAGLASPATPPT